MDEHHDVAALREHCVNELGDLVGAQLAALARPAFEVSPARAGEGVVEGAGEGVVEGAGRWMFGGPALLAPGTPWPHFGGLPLSSLAVLDLRTGAGWLDVRLPEPLGLLSLFILDPDLDYEQTKDLDYDDPRWLRAVPVDPATAIEVPAPPPARSYEPTPVYARRIFLLPDEWGDEVARIDLGEGGGNRYPGMVVGEACRAWNGQFGDVAFGWPQWELGPAPGHRGDWVPILKISDQVFPACPWPTLYFSIPADALRAGDFGQTTVYAETY
jgi:hypothetical protein